MRIYIPDPAEFFGFLERAGLEYVALTGPDTGAVMILAEDLAMAQIGLRYHAYRAGQGVLCDVYSVTGDDYGDYLGHSFYPEALAHRLLDGRRPSGAGTALPDMYVPAPRAHLLALAYHLAYRLGEESGLALAEHRETSHAAQLDALARDAGIDLPHTLLDFHEFLKKEGAEIPYDVLVSYIQQDGASPFRSLLAAGQKGEMTLFLLRAAAVRTGAASALISLMRHQYKTIVVKDIPLLDQLRHARRFGGRPAVAVVAYDPQPIPATEDSRAENPDVFNQRRFITRDWRDAFIENTGAPAHIDPVWAADNEALAITTLPLFFSRHEQQDIFHRLAILREDA